MTSIAPERNEQAITAKEAMRRKFYENKCVHPSLEDILNCIYELQYNNLALLIHQVWNAEDAVFGEKIRARFKQDFLEVSEIEVLEKLENGRKISEPKLKLVTTRLPIKARPF